MNIQYENAAFKDFENIDGQNVYATALAFETYPNFLRVNDHLKFRIESLSPYGPAKNLMLPGDNTPARCVRWFPTVILPLVNNRKSCPPSLIALRALVPAPVCLVK